MLHRTATRRACCSFTLLLVFSLPGLCEETAALTNDSIVMMTNAGLSIDLVIAKIRQAPRVDFKVEVDDLVQLKGARVPEEVIKVMLERSSATRWGQSAAAGAATSGAAPIVVTGDPWGGVREDLGIEFIKVALEVSGGTIPIKLLRGEMTTSGFMGYRLQFMDYPGLKARARTTERRPSLLVRSSSPVTGGHYFLAKLEADEDDSVRSLKVSSAKNRLKAAFGGSDRSFFEPDHDWVVEFAAVEESSEVWRVTPKQDLEPGEYGWYIDPRTMTLLSERSGLQSQQEGGLFDFGVD